MRCYPASVAAVLLMLGTGAAADSPSSACGETVGYSAPQPYVAVRRLEAENRKSGKQGWMEARTTLGNDGLLAVEVLAEGGSEYIRNKVLRAALEGERQLVARRLPVHPPTPPDAYESAEPVPDESGLLRVPLRPGRKESDGLVIGHMFLQPSTGDVVRVVGRLTKSPSFWISQVDVVWEYARVNDTVLPVSFYSTAKVKMFGPSTFRMTYDYLSVDGEPILSGSRASR